MLMTILIGTAAAAQAYGTPTPAPTISVPIAGPAPVAAPAAVVPGRTLKDLPRTTITYYDVPGKTGPAIEKALKKMLADPTKREMMRLSRWDVEMQIIRQTSGTACTVQSAKSTLTATVQLPRLAEQAKVPKNVMANWQTYVAGVEQEAADNLWFVSDRLRGADQSVVGLNCDQANSAWTSKLDQVRTEIDAFLAQRIQAAGKPPARR